jgi:replicative DNA helicase
MMKLPPNDIELEKVILGAYIIEPDSYYNYPVESDSFYKHEHQIICTCIKEIADKGGDIDLITMNQRLTAKEEIERIGGVMYLAELTQNVASAGHLEYHVAILQNLSQRRKMITKANELLSSCYDMSDDQQYMTKLTELNESATNSSEESVVTNQQAIESLRKRVEENQTRTDRLTGVPTGLRKVDDFSYGLQGGELIVIGGQSSQGKTSLALSITKNTIVDYDTKAAMISFEMTNEQIVARMASQSSGVDSKKILNSKLFKDEMEQFDSAVSLLESKPFYMLKKTSMSIENLLAFIRKLKLKYDIDIVIIDFLQRMRPNNGMNKTDFYAYASQKLKDVALELNIPIVLLSQLNRDKDRPEPTMDRLRASGEIEEAADTILMIWRPEYYGIEEIEYKGERYSSDGLAWLKIEKGRNMGVGKILLRFTPELTKFDNFEENTQFEDRYDPNAGLNDNEPF